MEIVKKILPPARLVRAARTDALIGGNTLRDLYEQAVNRLVRLRYSSGDEHAITNKFLLGDPSEFNEKMSYVTACKAAVKAHIKEVTGIDV